MISSRLYWCVSHSFYSICVFFLLLYYRIPLKGFGSICFLMLVLELHISDLGYVMGLCILEWLRSLLSVLLIGGAGDWGRGWCCGAAVVVIFNAIFLSCEFHVVYFCVCNRVPCLFFWR